MRTMSSQRVCRIALFMIWLILLTPVYTANALTITFSPGSDMSVDDQFVMINWTTDESSTGTIYYGTPGKETNTQKSSTSKTSHSVKLEGLSVSTKFNFYIEAKNSTGSTVRSPTDGGDFHTFTTLAKKDRTAPAAVTGLAAPTITNSAITVSWTAPSDTDVEKYIIYRNRSKLTTTTTTSYTDSGLNASTTYEYKVGAVDNSSNEGPNTTVTAKTQSKDYQPITISNFKAYAIGSNIFLTWTTNVASHSRVRYGQNPLLLDQKKEVSDNVTQHNITLTGLTENTNYTVRAESCDRSGNCGNSTATTVATATKVDLFLTLDGLDCSTSTKAYARSTRMDIKGKSAPGADVEVYVNGKRDRFKRITSTGLFDFIGVTLDSSKTENHIKITASDKVSADKTCEEYVLLDTMEPEVHFSNETLNMTMASSSSVSLTGNLTDMTKVTLYIYLQSVDDTTAPPQVSNVTNTSLTSSSVKIGWNAFSSNETNASDLYKYYVYRSDVTTGPIAYTESTITYYEDKNVSSGTTYTYQVSAVDKAGNEGTKSSAFSVTTSSGNTTASPVSAIVAPNPSLLTTKYYTPQNNSISFTETVTNLFQGKNSITLKYVDEAGNEYKKTFSIYYDKDPPKIISPTSAELQSYYSPSYTSEIAIKGQVNKKAGKVLIWVDKSSASVSTSSLGTVSSTALGTPDYTASIGTNSTFEVDVALTTTIAGAIASSVTSAPSTSSANQSAQSSGLSTTSSTGVPTKITMIYVDEYGRESQPVTGSVQYTPCGDKYYWHVKLQHGGNVMNTRELLEGVAAYGFGFELDWTGGGDKTKAKAQSVKVTKATIGSKDAAKYDFDWLSGDPVVLCNRGNCTKGFVQLNFLPKKPTGDTYLEMEKNLSSHRKGECFPGLGGCIHLLLEMQIYSDQGPFTAQYAASGGAPVGTQALGVQKQCVDIKIMLDERVNFASSEFVRNLLNASLKAINATISFLNIIEKPVVYAAQITLGLCLLSYISKFIVDAYTSYTCKWSGAISQLTKGGAFALAKEVKDGMIEKVADMDDGTGNGACALEFDGNSKQDKAARDACKECSSMKRNSEWITDKWHLFCDRVMCPSVPSLQHYIYSKWTGGKKSLWTPDPAELGKAAAEASKAGQTNKCRTYNSSDTGQGFLAITEDCDCGGTCKSGSICVGGTTCTFVTKTCTDKQKTSEYCLCGAGGVCAPEQTCTVNTGACAGRVPGSTSSYPDCPATAATADCKCGVVDSKDVICKTGETCKDKKTCVAATTAPASKAVTDINDESSSLTIPEDQGYSIPLITGFQTKSGAVSYGSSNPVYDRFLPYQKGDWQKSYIKKAKSDCEFAEMGRAAMKSMYDFYNGKEGVGSAQDRKACEGPHKPQPACCPFEYMSEWGWGMMFSNEVQNSYCLADPGAEECGIGTKIVNGVTGICQPQSSAKRAVPVMLDDLRYDKASGYLDSDEVLRWDVGYLVEIDEKGNIKTARRGWFSKSELKSKKFDGTRIEVTVGNYFVPANDAQDISSSFPSRDNADLSKDSDDFKKALAAFKKDIDSANDRKILTRKSKQSFTAKISGDDPYEHWFRQIYGLIGEPGRQYLAQPEGSFVQSLITLCLSGIATWIVMLKNMLTQLAMCFHTILVTGDGSAGQCQQLISQYVCDLIKEVISCIVQRFGGGASARVGIGGIGGFFSSVADASQSITSEAQSRYGDKNILTSTFAAENIVHDACIFMFTGEWPTDWTQLFQTAAYLPVNSSVLILRPTRRYQVYDPKTGYARYVYRIGYTVFAGADIQFDLQLVCSDGSCTEGKDGKCDCGHGSASDYSSKNPTLNIKRHGTGNCPESGQLKQLQSCTDEILFVGTGFYPLRYDKVRIKYYPTGGMGSGKYGGSAVTTAASSAMGGSGLGGVVSRPGAVSGTVDSPITEIGGPPQGLCEFDILQFAFRCGISVPKTGSATFISTKLTKESNEYFGIGDSDIAQVKIAQKLPANAASCSTDCEFTKYLVISKITNGVGATVYPTSSNVVGERLNQEKLWDLNVFSDSVFLNTVKENSGGFEIKAEHFGKQAPGACQQDSALELGAQSRIVVMNRDCSKVSSTSAFGIIVKYDGTTKFTYDFADKTTLGNWNARGKESPCTGTIDTTKNSVDYTINCGGLNLTVLGDYVRSGGNVISRNGKAPAGSKPKTGIYGVAYTPPASTTTSLTCAKQPETWKMYLELRDAVSASGTYKMSNAPSVDPDTNKQQTTTVEFKVLCAKSTTAKANSGSIKDLTYSTAVLTSDNTAYNKSYGMWVPDNYLGPKENIKVADFKWIDSTKPQQGFSITLDSEAANGILNIDLTDLNVIPGSSFQVEKIQTGATSGTVLKTCGKSPCVQTVADVNSRVLTLRVSKGDPTFKFTGFQGATGAALMTAGTEIVLNSKQTHYPSQSDFFLYLDSSAKIPDNMNATFKKYVEGTSNASVNFSTSPSSLMDPIRWGLCLNSRGFDMSNAKVKIDGVDISQKQTGVSPGRSTVYIANSNCVSVQTLGSSGETVEIYSLQKISTTLTTSLKDASGQPFTLTSTNPAQYGVRAAGLDSDGQVLISSVNINDKDKTVTLSVKVDGQKTEPVKLSVELLPLGFNGDSKTTVEMSGKSAVLSTCGSTYSEPCIVSTVGDRIVFSVGKSTNAQFRFKDLQAVTGASKACADKAAGASCTIEGTKITGTCWEPSISGATMQCYSACRKSYVSANMDALKKNYSNLITEEKMFCISSSDKCVGGKSALSGLCGDSSLVCCQEGKGGVSPKPAASTSGGAKQTITKSPIVTHPTDGRNYIKSGSTWYLCMDSACTLSKATKLDATKDAATIKTLESELNKAYSTSTSTIGSKCGTTSEQNNGYKCVRYTSQGSICDPSQISTPMTGGGYLSCSGVNFEQCCKPLNELGEGNSCATGALCTPTCSGTVVTPTTAACKTGTVCCQITSGNCGVGVSGMSSYMQGGATLYTATKQVFWDSTAKKANIDYSDKCDSGKYCIPGFTTPGMAKTYCQPPESTYFTKYYCKLITAGKCAAGCSASNDFKQLVSGCFYAPGSSSKLNMDVPLDCYLGNYDEKSTKILNDYGVTVYSELEIYQADACSTGKKRGLKAGESDCYFINSDDYANYDNRDGCTKITSSDFKKYVCANIKKNKCSKGDRALLCSFIDSNCASGEKASLKSLCSCG